MSQIESLKNSPPVLPEGKDYLDYLEEIQNTKDKLVLQQLHQYYTNWLVRTQVYITDKIETAAVCRDGYRFALLVNPTFWDSLSSEHRCGVIKHELLHLVFKHVSSSYYWAENFDLLNVAMDLVINQIVGKKHLPDFACFPDFFNLPENLTTWEYYHLLIAKCEKQGEGGKPTYLAGDNNFDMNGELIPEDQRGSGTATSAQVPMDDSEIEQMLNGMAQSAYNLSQEIGNLPGEIQGMLGEITAPPKISWKDLLRNFFGQATPHYKFKRKYHRKYYDSYPERAHKYKKFKPNILVGVDVSGSMTLEIISAFFNEIDAIYELGTVEVVTCDTRITERFTYEGVHPKSVKGGGGTELQPICDISNKENFDLVIVLTDGHFEGCTTDKPSLWVATETLNFNITGSHSKILMN